MTDLAPDSNRICGNQLRRTNESVVEFESVELCTDGSPGDFSPLDLEMVSHLPV